MRGHRWSSLTLLRPCHWPGYHCTELELEVNPCLTRTCRRHSEPSKQDLRMAAQTKRAKTLASAIEAERTAMLRSCTMAGWRPHCAAARPWISSPGLRQLEKPLLSSSWPGLLATTSAAMSDWPVNTRGIDAEDTSIRLTRHSAGSPTQRGQRPGGATLALPAGSCYTEEIISSLADLEALHAYGPEARDRSLHPLPSPRLRQR